MAMTPTGMKNAIVAGLAGAGATIENEAALEALATAIVQYIQANAAVTVTVTTTGTATAQAGGGSGTIT